MEFTKFLLVYPKFPDTYWSYRHALEFVGKRALMPPLGLATIAAMIPECYPTRIIDMNVEELTDDDIMATDLVLVSAMIVQRDSFVEVVQQCNRLGTPVAVGGPYATSCPEDMTGADYLVLDEGELTFPAFLSDYLAGNPKPRYHAESRADITTAPVPRYDLFDMAFYDTIPIQYSRGCPFDCEFCDIVHLFGHKPRTKSSAQFLAELDAAYETGFRGSVFIVDDNFIGNKREVAAMLRDMVKWQADHGYPFHLATEASINLADDDELLDLMVAAGFAMVFIGIETPVEASLRQTGKTQNLRRSAVDSVRKIQARGIEVTAGFVIGFDDDPEDIFELQRDFVAELAVPVAMSGLLMALPHTRLYDRLEQEGRLLSASNGNNTHGVELNFVPKLPARFLTDGYVRLLADIYSPRTYFARSLDFLGRLPRIPHRSARRGPAPGQRAAAIGAREIGGLLRSLRRQTFSRYGLLYLAFLVRAFLKRPRRIVQIVTLAAQGHHFFTITGEIVRQHTEQDRYAKKSRYRVTEPDERATIGVNREITV